MHKLINDVVSNAWSSLIANPVRAISLSVFVCCLFGFGLTGLKLNASYSAYFDPDDPILGEHRTLQSMFSIRDGLLIVLEFQETAALEPQAIALLSALTTKLKSLDIVVKVSSVLNLRASDDAEFDDLDQELFSLDEGPASDEIITEIDALAVKDDPRGQGLLLSNDASAVALEVTLDLSEKASAPELLEALSIVHAAVDKTMATSPIEAQVRYSGPLALNEAYISVIRHDLKVFLPVLVISIALIVTLVFGSFKLTLIALSIAILSIVSAFGFAGWLNAELAAINAFAPVMIASLALAGAVHIFNSYYQKLSEGQDNELAIKAAVQDNAFPLALTSVTTAGGFIALLFSPSPPIRTIGLIVALGVLFAWLYIMLLLPALLNVSNARPTRAKWLGVFIERVHHLTTKFPKQILLFAGIVVVITMPLVVENQVNDNVFEYFPTNHQFKRDLNFIDSHFSGINPQIFSVATLEPYGALDLDVLRTLDKFQMWLAQQPEVKKTLSMTDFPQVRAQLEQPGVNGLSSYKELAKMHTPRALGIEKLIDDDYQSLALHVYVEPLDARALIAFSERAKHKLESAFPTLKVANGGTSLVFAHLGQRNAQSMIYALIAAVITVSIICTLMLRSWHGMWIGVLCNLLPLSIVYALWALIDGKISIGGAVVVGMILGIIVDDTLYLLAKFRRAINSGETSPHVSTLSDVGPALVITSVAIVIGLSAGLLSDFAPIKAMSGLSMSVVSVALIIDLFCLTIILSWLNRRYRNMPVAHQNTKNH